MYIQLPIIYIIYSYICISNFSATAAIASTVQIECASESIIVHISTEGNTDFHGLVYPRGLSKNSTCLQEYRSQPAPITYNLPLRSCNTMPTELVSLSTRIIVRYISSMYACTRRAPYISSRIFHAFFVFMFMFISSLSANC